MVNENNINLENRLEELTQNIASLVNLLQKISNRQFVIEAMFCGFAKQFFDTGTGRSNFDEFAVFMRTGALDLAATGAIQAENVAQVEHLLESIEKTIARDSINDSGRSSDDVLGDDLIN